VAERLTFSPENIPPKVQEKLKEIEGEKNWRFWKIFKKEIVSSSKKFFM
jgi:uncharacterized FlgJ-related protein